MDGHDSKNHPVCVLPGCTSAVTGWGQSCENCLQLFDEHLQPTFEAPLTGEQIDARDGAVQQAYAHQKQIHTPAPRMPR